MQPQSHTPIYSRLPDFHSVTELESLLQGHREDWLSPSYNQLLLIHRHLPVGPARGLLGSWLVRHRDGENVPYEALIQVLTLAKSA